MTNFSSAHESNWGKIGAQRLAYPSRHIEVDNRLVWLLGRLDKLYGNDAFYVHLRRDREAVAKSYNLRWSGGRSIIVAYAKSILWFDDECIEVCRDYVDCVTENVDSFLKDKTNTMDVNLETIEHDFSAFWQWIGARGDLAAAVREFDHRHNASELAKAKRESRFVPVLRQVFNNRKP